MYIRTYVCVCMYVDGYRCALMLSCVRVLASFLQSSSSIISLCVYVCIYMCVCVCRWILMLSCVRVLASFLQSSSSIISLCVYVCIYMCVYVCRWILMLSCVRVLASFLQSSSSIDQFICLCMYLRNVHMYVDGSRCALMMLSCGEFLQNNFSMTSLCIYSCMYACICIYLCMQIQMQHTYTYVRLHSTHNM